MIAVSKYSNNECWKFASPVEEKGKLWVSNFYPTGEEPGAHGAYVTAEEYILHFTESEVQQRIEAALAEHLAATQETDDLNEILRNKVNKLEATDHELRACIEKLQLKCDRLEEEKDDLNECVAELEAERQPVEVSAELAEAIENISMELHWAAKFLDTQYVTNRMGKFPALQSVDYFQRVEIIKRGYAVKPDPLRERIAAILGNDHKQLDAVVAAAREEEAE